MGFLVLVGLVSGGGGCERSEDRSVSSVVGEEGEPARTEEEKVSGGLWPELRGRSPEVGKRHREAVRQWEELIAKDGHSLLAARLNMVELQARWHHLLGDDEFWPEVLEIEPIGGGQESSEVSEGGVGVRLELAVSKGSILESIGERVRQRRGEESTELHLKEMQGGMVGEGAALALRFVAHPGEMKRFWEEVVPADWWGLFHVGTWEERQKFRDLWQGLWEIHQGPTTVALFEGRRRWTGEVFIGWEPGAGLDREELEEKMESFHRELFRGFWMPLQQVEDLLRDEVREESLAGEVVAIHERTFPISHGGYAVGVCWTIRGEQVLSYYGLEPCRRLAEVVEQGLKGGQGRSGLTGELGWLVGRLYNLPEQPHWSFSRHPLRFQSQWDSQGPGHLEMRLFFAESAAMETILEEVPELVASWKSGEGPAESARALSLERPSFQDPGVVSLGVPGVGGVFPPALLLGPPFSFAPTAPELWERLSQGEEPGEYHPHAHHH